MKVKALRYKETKEFVHIRFYDEKYRLFTSSLPKIQPETATIELMEKFFPVDKREFDDFDNLEFVELDIIEVGEVGADIRNKLSPPKNLIALLEVFFEAKVGYLPERQKLVNIIQKEMEQSKKSIDYIANLL